MDKKDLEEAFKGSEDRINERFERVDKRFEEFESRVKKNMDDKV